MLLNLDNYFDIIFAVFQISNILLVQYTTQMSQILQFKYKSSHASTQEPIFLKHFCRLLPESPRWLIAKGRVDEANVILHKFAKANGMSYPEEKLEIALVYIIHLCIN